MMLMDRFLDAIQDIKKKKPTYRLTGTGTDGTCDCIGLIIGAIRRIGVSWKGDDKHPAIHGSNYAARYQVRDLKYVSSLSQLSLGDAVFKARESGESKYSLPSRYKSGGGYYNGDLKDYYHVGVVTSTSPVQITHMTTPTVKVDTKIGKWNYAGKLVLLTGKGSGETQSPSPIPVQQEDNIFGKALVYSANGAPVKMRAKPSTTCCLWDKLEPGTEVTILEHGEEWCKVSSANRKGWYMMTKFLKAEG